MMINKKQTKRVATIQVDEWFESHLKSRLSSSNKIKMPTKQAQKSWVKSSFDIIRIAKRQSAALQRLEHCAQFNNHQLKKQFSNRDHYKQFPIRQKPIKNGNAFRFFINKNAKKVLTQPMKEEEVAFHSKMSQIIGGYRYKRTSCASFNKDYRRGQNGGDLIRQRNSLNIKNRGKRVDNMNPEPWFATMPTQFQEITSDFLMNR